MVKSVQVERQQTAETNDEAIEGTTPVVIDMGSCSKKKIKRLKKGRGPLLDNANSFLEELKAEGKIDAKAQPVFIVVKEKHKLRFPFLKY